MRDSVRRAQEVCPVEVSIAVLGGAWKMTVVKHLAEGTKRFGELGRAVGPVTPRTLTRQLRELEVDGVVHREVFPEVPPRVEYSLTPLGRSLGDLVAGLDAWGKRYLQDQSGPPGQSVDGASPDAGESAAAPEPSAPSNLMKARSVPSPTSLISE